MPSSPYREGDTLRGKYRVRRVLGAGGMGVVVLARHLRLDQNVAIKMLSEEAASKASSVARFAREARAAARIRSDHVVRILDVDESESGTPFIVMEYLEGSDLEAVLRDEGPLAIERAVSFVLQACVGLAEAHALGIVHRDLKPANLFLANRRGAPGIVKILDFGISKISTREGDGALGVTQADRAIGSPSYMSPEQLKSSRDVDARTDLWSLGVTLHQLVSGRLPFDAENATALGALIATEPPEPLRRACPHAPEELERVVARCLEKDRDKRFENVAELAMKLAPFAPADAAIAEHVRSLLFAPRLSSGRQLASAKVAADDPQTASLDPPTVSKRSLPAATADNPVAISTAPQPAPSARRASTSRARSLAMAIAIAGATVLAVIAWSESRSSPGARGREGAPTANAASSVAASTTPATASTHSPTQSELVTAPFEPPVVDAAAAPMRKPTVVPRSQAAPTRADPDMELK